MPWANWRLGIVGLGGSSISGLGVCGVPLAKWDDPPIFRASNVDKFSAIEI